MSIEDIYIWEHEFQELLRTNEKAKRFVETLDLQERLDPRAAFYGGRVNATKLHYKQRLKRK